MVDLFLSDTPARLNALRSAAAAGDAESLARGAHSLVGSAGNVGAIRMVALCRALDQAARAGHVDDAAAMVARVQREYELVETALRSNLSADAE